MARTRITKLATAAAVAIAAGGLAVAAIPGAALAAPFPQPSTASSPFRIAPSPSPGSTDSRLVASAAISANDVWAVGGTDATKPLAEHWNGSTWSVVPTPSPGTGAGFTAVSAVSSSDVWAIGTFGFRQQQQPFTEHWNGSAWSIVALADPTATNNNVVFTGVKAISPTNVYAVGSYQALTYPYEPMQFIEHWNGTNWRVLANPFDAVIPSGIDASSASDIWIVGDQRSGPFTEHFNGTVWSVVPTPVRMTISAVLDLSPTNAWSVGDEVAHWNGTAWKVVPNPVSYNSGIHLQAITALSATDLWAVGYSYHRLSATPRRSLSISTARHGRSCRPRAQAHLESSEVSAALPLGTCTPWDSRPRTTSPSRPSSWKTTRADAYARSILWPRGRARLPARLRSGQAKTRIRRRPRSSRSGFTARPSQQPLH
ncbi:MAG: hypothetical protein DLM58_00880 [Pseudonocardiales bacterium]|nr:MAG: hypothetical protein DLM58_00880 [Pseudonocardiales bacterium]